MHTLPWQGKSFPHLWRHHAPFLCPAAAMIGAHRTVPASTLKHLRSPRLEEGGARPLNHQQHLCFAWEVSCAGTRRA